MLDLLLKKDRKELKKEYLLRFLSVLFVFFIVVSLIGHFLIAPTYLLIRLQNEAIDEHLDQFKSSENAIKQEALEKGLGKLAGHFEIFKQETPQYSGFIKILEQTALGNVEINSITFRQMVDSDSNKSENLMIEVKGVAGQRKSLVDFAETLKGLEIFSSVDLPLSNLAKEFDVTFNIRIETKSLTINSYE